MHVPSYLNEGAFEDAFWKTVLETAGTVKIHPACAIALRHSARRKQLRSLLKPEDWRNKKVLRSHVRESPLQRIV
jgi:hypothetical protein